MSVFYRKDGHFGFITFDLADSKVNLLTADVMKRLDTLLDEIAKDAALKAVIIESKKKDVFIAGADIKEIEGITEPHEGELKARSGQKILDKLEDLRVPTVAVIDGVALGGGCELVLACRYRVATFNEKIRIGLPEVNLGILPGFGGTYRLPRLLGLSQGLNIILGGRVVPAKDALKFGLLDRQFPQQGLENHVRAFAGEVSDNAGRSSHIRPRKLKLPQKILDRTVVGHAIVFREARKNVLKQSKGFYPSPLKALDVIEKTLYMNRDSGMRLEAKAFGDLSVTPVCKNLIHVFYLSEKYKKLSIPGGETISSPEIKRCSVLGAGVMGGGIAQLLSQNGILVRLKDINHDAVAKGLQAAAKLFRQAVKRRRLSRAQAAARMARISPTTEYSGLGTTDCVIEAVVENLDVKKAVFQQVSALIPPQAIFCTNTSALSVTAMAEAARDPSRVIGFHFFNPVHRMPLVEIIMTRHTSPATAAGALQLAKRLGKTPILVQDAPGFLVNRILLAYINEAGRLLEEGVPAAVVDKMMTDFGMPMGPFLLSDEVGTDIGVKVLHILEAGLGERFKPVGIFEKVFEKKLLGKKSGKGFYIHSKHAVPNPDIPGLVGKPMRGQMTIQDYQKCRDRMVYTMINEAARCLEDKVVDEPAAVDVGMIMGTGFPPFRGGLMRYADQVGIGNVVDALAQFEKEFQADRFRPCRYLLDLKDQQKGFYR
ncbi:MAG: 3-hydroxyacyl-CoA dehydrogenase NAD-binding domain-containing protein [Candidatus Omnitrophota bacterium]|nr:3-hydroxyacyl-CoA dehydrogenase NAD-binding domain-containing protein [Candidatus Omnitrophota bacterium]MDZ4243078.1 3-hydroxyacyl-CoA dehydrogenase NAD-binding domain-containing protein [Candidatus Omnitrophota bacterium]